MKVSIVIPAYNEEKRIGNTLEEYGKYFKNLKTKKILDFEILVVINNSTDKTEDVVKSFSKKYKEIRYFVLMQKGKGLAITEGFKDALKRENEIIGFVDADMATPPEAYYDLVKNIGNYGGCIASRWIKGSVIKTPQSFLRRILSRGFNFLVRILFLMNYEDTQCGAKIFKKEVVEKITKELNITRWAFDVNLLYLCKKGKFKVIEWPTIWEDRKDSHLDVVGVPIQMFTGILRLRILNSPFKDLIKLYDKLPESIKLHHKF